MIGPVTEPQGGSSTHAPLLTTQEVADRASVVPQTVHRWVKQGRLRHVRLPSGTLRFRPDDVEALLTPVEATEAAS